MSVLEVGKTPTPKRMPKRGPLRIAEDLDAWHLAYSFIVFFVFLGFLPSVPLSQRTSSFLVGFNLYVTAYTATLAVWAFIFTVPALALTLWYRNDPLVQARRIRIFVRVRGLFWLMIVLLMGIVIAYIPLRVLPESYQMLLNVAGGYLVLAFYALLAVVGPGFIIYILNPAARTFLFEFPVGYKEKVGILSRFLEFQAIAGSRFAFLIAEAYGATSIVIQSGFRYLNPQGLGETFVDIQIAMRMGPPEEKEAVRQYFQGLRDVPYRLGTLGTSYSSEVLRQSHEVRTRLPWSDNIRTTNGIKGEWENGFIALLAPYRDWILLGLTLILVLATLALVLR